MGEFLYSRAANRTISGTLSLPRRTEQMVMNANRLLTGAFVCAASRLLAEEEEAGSDGMSGTLTDPTTECC